MKLAVMGDIHSNFVAFEVCIDYIKRESIDGIIFLGDTISDCPKPQRTLRMIKQLEKEYKVWHIRGNREEYFIRHADGEEDGWIASSYTGSLLYTYEHLTKEDIDRFRTYPSSRVISIPRMAPITIVHGSPVSSRELLYAEGENTNQYLEQLGTDYLICGHSHCQFMYSYYEKRLINPGSIGVAIGKKAVAHFAIMEWVDVEWSTHFIELPYDLEALSKEFYQSSLVKKAYIWPHCILKSIETGINMGPLCAKRAYDLAVEDKKEIHGRVVEEAYWRQAAAELDII